MDTSKEYIKMCQKAEEIQDLKCLYDMGEIGIKVVGADWFYLYDTDTNNPKIIWLPRQDQLQEMVRRKIEHPFGLVAFLAGFVEAGLELKLDWMQKIFSMEQLWLAFVMKERHNKTWDGEKWNSYKDTITKK